jgi:Ca2+-transporting ATPase
MPQQLVVDSKRAATGHAQTSTIFHYYKNQQCMVDAEMARSLLYEGPMSETTNTPALWHAMATPEVLVAFETTPAGLSEGAARERRARFGPNRIERVRRDGPFKLLWRQLNNPLLFVLIASGTAAVLMGKLTDGAVVLGVVAINTAIGFAQELQASKAIASLLEMVPQLATVFRDGGQASVSATELVPGDVVILRPGEKVPADVRLLTTKNLLVEEAPLTGESTTVTKQIAAVSAEAVLGDRTSMLFAGTLVAAGAGTGVVIATGNQTELGRISGLLRDAPTLDTPLTQSMAKVSKWLTLVILAVTGALFGVGLLRGYPLADATIAAISLAVAAIPEGLPAIITITLAIGVRRMAERRVIIRRLPAVETLGSTTVICTDKTGTLTRNEMTVQGLWVPEGLFQLSGVGYAPEGELAKNNTLVGTPAEHLNNLVIAGALCNDASLRKTGDGRWVISGDPTEAALVVAARKLGHNENQLRSAWPRLDVVLFASETQIMGTLHQAPDKSRVIFVKGAPEAVIARCVRNVDGSTLDVHAVQDRIELLAAKGMRVLAVARKAPTTSIDEITDHDLETDFELLGLQGMIDPPRVEAIEAVRACQNAGITVKMITGDHQATARAIGEELGLLNGTEALSGRQVEKMSAEELREAVGCCHVFARVAPEHKLRLVRALQERNQIVAMTGDGVNDAPALKTANIGVAMGLAGTSVAKEAADMVLTDDNFASIAASVEEGRRVFDNLIKSLAFVLPTNIGEALVILVAVLFFPIANGTPVMPILPVQILWVNLVATVALALPLAFEALEPNVMNRPPRIPQSPILGGFVLARSIYVAVLIAAVAIGIFLVEYALLRTDGPGSSVAKAQTIAVTAIVMFQIFYLFNCRSLDQSVFDIGFFTNRAVFYGVGLIAVYLPFMNDLFGTEPLGPVDLTKATTAGAVVLPVLALEKHLRRRRQRRKAV